MSGRARGRGRGRGGGRGRGRGGGNKRGGGRSRPAADNGDFRNEVDKFSDDRDMVGLDPEQDDKEDSMSEHEDVAMAGGAESSDDDLHNDDDEDEEDRAEKTRVAEQREANISTAWGKRRKDYYGDEIAENFDKLDADLDAAKEEEVEVKRLQAEQAEELTEEQFEAQQRMLQSVVTADAEKKAKSAKQQKEEAAAAAKAESAAKKLARKPRHGDSWDEDGDAEMGAQDEAEEKIVKPAKSADAPAKGKGKQVAAAAAAVESKSAKKAPAKAKAAAAAAAADDDAKVLAEFDAAEHGFGAGDVSVERVTKDLSRLTNEEKLAQVAKDSPELLPLLEDFKLKTQEIRSFLTPLLQRIKDQKLPTSQGISFLETKFHMLLSYCTHLSFYFLLKAEGKRVVNHPVIKSLAHLRTMIEKTKPIEKKLQYQIDKLVKSVHMSGSTPDSDPLAFKPNPDRLVKPTQSTGDEEADASAAGDVYVPPKLAAVVPEWDESAKIRQKKQREREINRKSKNKELASALAEEIGEMPEVEETGEGKLDARDQEIEDYELEHFVRLQDTKADKARRKKNAKITATDAYEDFADFSALTEAKEDEDMGLRDFRAEKRKQQAAQAAAGKKRKRGDDDDGFGGAGAGELLYNETQQSAKRRRKEHKDAHPLPQQFLSEDDPDVADGRRGAGKAIEKNEGLKRYRPRDRKTPRTNARHKAKQADKRQNSVVQKFKGSQHVYGGEATGIKPGLTRSTKLSS